MPQFFGFLWSDWCLGFISGGGEGQMAEVVVSYTGLTACPRLDPALVFCL